MGTSLNSNFEKIITKVLTGLIVTIVAVLCVAGIAGAIGLAATAMRYALRALL